MWLNIFSARPPCREEADGSIRSFRPDGGCLLEALCCQCVSLSWRSSWWRLGVWRCFHTWTHPTRGCWSHWGLFVEVWNLYVEWYFCWRLVLLQSVIQRDENNRGSGGTSRPSADRRSEDKWSWSSVVSPQTSCVFWPENHRKQQRPHPPASLEHAPPSKPFVQMKMVFLLTPQWRAGDASLVFKCAEAVVSFLEFFLFKPRSNLRFLSSALQIFGHQQISNTLKSWHH